jgi:fibronectin-binding autotransporter adhesin
LKNHAPSIGMAFVVLTLFTLRFLTATGAAQTSWTGATDGVWGTAGNWDPSGVPTNNAALTFGTATTYDVNLGGVTRTIGASTFSGDYTFTNGTLASGATWTGTAGKTVSINGVLSNTANRTISSGDWVLSGNTAGSRLTLSGATLRFTGSGNNTSQLYLQSGATAVYDKAFTVGLGNQVLAFEGGAGGTLRALTALNFQATMNIGSANSVVANDSGGLVNFGGSIQFVAAANPRLTLTSTNGGVFRFDNWIGLSTVTTSAITIVTDALTTNGATAGRGIRDHVSGTAGAMLSLIKQGTNDLVHTAGASNTYSGFTRIDSGAVEIQRMDQLGNSANAPANLVLNGGTLRYASTASAVSPRGFSVGTGVSSGGLEVVDAAATLTIGGTTTGSGTFHKLGPGTLVLSGDGSARTGPNVVQAGVLAVDGSLGGMTRVNSGATLGGSGTLEDATISGLHSPGGALGVQTFSGRLTYGRGATVVWDLASHGTGARGTGHDGVDVGGALTFGGATKLRLRFGTTVDWTDSFWSGEYLGRDGWLIFQAGAPVTGVENLTIEIAPLLDGQGRPLDCERGEFSLYHDAVSNAVYLNFARSVERGSMVGFR